MTYSSMSFTQVFVAVVLVLLAPRAGLLAPVEPNRTEEGRAKNRRVELVQQ